jgi:hypothetical protein
MNTVTETTRNIIRNEAVARDCGYRITRDGEVHFRGRMPNTNQDGWYFVGHDAESVAKDIQEGRF